MIFQIKILTEFCHHINTPYSYVHWSVHWPAKCHFVKSLCGLQWASQNVSETWKKGVWWPSGFFQKFLEQIMAVKAFKSTLVEPTPDAQVRLNGRDCDKASQIWCFIMMIQQLKDVSNVNEMFMSRCCTKISPAQSTLSCSHRRTIAWWQPFQVSSNPPANSLELLWRRHAASEKRTFSTTSDPSEPLLFGNIP